MKNLVTCILSCISIFVYAQQEPAGYSLREEDLASLEVLVLPSYNNQELLAYDTKVEQEGGMHFYGRVLEQELDFFSVARRFETDNGDQVYLLRFSSVNAKALGVLFNKFHLPLGAKLSLYSADRSFFEGPYDDKENNDHMLFRTAEIMGNEGVLEYVQPATTVGQAHLVLRGFSYLYRDVYDPRPSAQDSERASEFCQVDVRCPEGTPWEDQINAAVRLSIVSGGGIGFCSGSLVNNTNYDCKNYVLTAMHCIEGVSSSDFASLTVRFRYQKTGCGTGTSPTGNQRTGVFLRADSNDQGGNTGSDFALLELEDDIPDNYTPYFAGWDASNTVPSTAVTIHHPDGDVKKISTSNNVANGTWSLPGYHWRVIWAETQTNWGVTEGGSSGSPLLNSSKRIIGTLTGGGSFCDNPTSADYYGKMFRHWTFNPNPASEKLKVWLDPANTGLTAINGAYRSAEGTCEQSVEVTELEFADIDVYPSLAHDFINIRSDLYANIREVRVFNSIGALVETINMNQVNALLDVSAYSPGAYFITFVGVTSGHITKKVVVTAP
jgi:hypothetical protein